MAVEDASPIVVVGLRGVSALLLSVPCVILSGVAAIVVGLDVKSAELTALVVGCSIGGWFGWTRYRIVLGLLSSSL